MSRPVIWVASVDHKHGTNLYAAASEAGVWSELAGYCRQSWEKDGPGEPPVIVLTDKETVERYFEWMAEIGGSEGYTVSAVGLSITPDEADVMRYDCQIISGCHPLATLTNAAVLEVARDRWGEDPCLPGLVATACERVASRWSGGDSGMQDTAESMAMARIAEWAPDHGLMDRWKETEGDV